MELHFRKIETDDTSLIYSAWLKSYRGLPYGRTMTTSIFFDGHKKVVEGILDVSEVLLAVNPEDHAEVYGFICYNNDMLHYAYTKYKYRKLGIATSLMNKVGGIAQFTLTSHLPRNWSEIFTKYGLAYNPY